MPESQVTFWGDSAVHVSMLSQMEYNRYFKDRPLLQFDDNSKL